MSFRISAFVFFHEIPINGMVGSYDGSVLNFLRTLHTVTHSGLTYLDSHHQGMMVPFSLHCHGYLLVIVFWPILTGGRWHPAVVLICMSVMISYLSVFSCACWPPVCLLWKSIYSMHFLFFHLVGWIFFWYWIVRVLWNILDINALSDALFANIFFHLVGGLFFPLIVSFAVQKLFSVI